MSSKNPCAKTRPVDDPYEIWIAGDWEWRVLKKYQSYKEELKNWEYARWYVAVKSPMTFGSWEYGDEYVKNIVNLAEQIVPNECMDCKLPMVRVARLKTNPDITTLEGCSKCGIFTYRAGDKMFWSKAKLNDLDFVN
jgi:hypothetical protein